MRMMKADAETNLPLSKIVFQRSITNMVCLYKMNEYKKLIDNKYSNTIEIWVVKLCRIVSSLEGVESRVSKVKCDIDKLKALRNRIDLLNEKYNEYYEMCRESNMQNRKWDILCVPTFYLIPYHVLHTIYIIIILRYRIDAPGPLLILALYSQLHTVINHFLYNCMNLQQTLPNEKFFWPVCRRCS